MGLAAKLAASNNNAQGNTAGTGSAGYPAIYQAAQGPPVQAQAFQQPQVEGYAAQPPPSPFPISGGPSQNQMPVRQVPGVNFDTILKRFEHIVDENELHAFYSQARLEALARKVLNSDLAGLAERWQLDTKLVLDVVALALYDIVILADDSGSMKACEEGTRIDDLKAILVRITEAITILDTDGIDVRFLNQEIAGNNLKTAQAVIDFVGKAKYGGVTPLGTMLESKILKPFVRGPAKSGNLHKPVSVIVITDGEPCGEPDGHVRTVIKDTKKALAKSHYGDKAVTFQFVQVGRDEMARRFLGKLDNDPKIGCMVDATSYYEFEQEEFQKNNPGMDLSPELYLVKLLLGANDPAYDKSDEKRKKKKPPGMIASFFKLPPF